MPSSDVQSLRSEYHVMLSATSDPDTQERIGSALNGRAFVLLEQAMDLAGHVEESEITTAEFSALGNLLLDFGRLEDASEILENAAASAKSDLERAATIKDVARARFANGDKKGGRAKFVEALDVASDSTNPLSRFQIPYIHEAWGEMERIVGDEALARLHFVKAKEAYEALQPLFGEQAAMGLERVRVRIRKLTAKEERTHDHGEADGAAGA